MECLQCGEITNNPKFCSRSCSATYTNKKHPKRKRKTICGKDGCNLITKSYKHTLCEDHWGEHNEWRVNNIKNKTIGEYRNRNSVKGKHPSWLHAGIRGLCRTWLKHLSIKPCANCGYDKHVELCHIKGVSEFDDSALLCEVNSEENVIQLCRNCHWEFDNGLIELDNIR